MSRRRAGLAAVLALGLATAAGCGGSGDGGGTSTAGGEGARGGTLHILSSILDQITALGAIRSFLPTHFSDAWLGLLTTPMQTDNLVRGCIAALSYAVIFFGLAWWRFLRKDVVS